MAGVFKRATDKARGKQGKWTLWYYDADRRRRTRAGFTDKAKTLELAQKLETDAGLVQNGMLDPVASERGKSALAPIADHVAKYRQHLLDKGGELKHADATASVITRLATSADILTAKAITFERVQAGLAAWKESGKSARTCNHALGAIKAFVGWLEDTDRIAAAPKGFHRLQRFNEKADTRVIRRALSREELARLLAVVEASEPLRIYRGARSGAKGTRGADKHRFLTGAQRAALYRLAMGTGFRADEIRTLTPEAFHLDGPEPFIRIKAENEKAGRGADQPITVELAATLKPVVALAPAQRPIMEIPEKTAQLLRIDLERAGIPYKTPAGVIDFHALRASFITHLVQDGVHPKVIQHLARHSTITLTMDRYAKMTRSDVREGLERKE